MKRQYERDESNERSPDLSSSNSSLSYSGQVTDPDLNSSHSSISSWGCHLEAVQRLLAEGDALVEELGVPGTHPLVVRAADEVASAIAFGDFPTLQHAVGEFKNSVRYAAHGRALGTKEANETN
jgi:hypothetical protein